MKVFNRINPTKVSHHFEVKINGNAKFTHKQTAARLLTLNKNRLSADRLSRVQATNNNNKI